MHRKRSVADVLHHGQRPSEESCSDCQISQHCGVLVQIASSEHYCVRFAPGEG